MLSTSLPPSSAPGVSGATGVSGAAGGTGGRSEPEGRLTGATLGRFLTGASGAEASSAAMKPPSSDRLGLFGAISLTPPGLSLLDLEELLNRFSAPPEESSAGRFRKTGA